MRFNHQLNDRTFWAFMIGFVVTLFVLITVLLVVAAVRHQHYAQRCHRAGGFVDTDHCISTVVELHP